MLPEGKRSQDQILAQAPIEVTLGEVVYKIKPLRILKSRDWRQSMMTKMGEVTNTMRGDMGSDAAFLSGLGYVLLQFPEILADLVFEYAPDLPKDKIMDSETGATEEQIAVAFSKILAVAFPFMGELKTVMMTLGASATSRS
jgi:hypothetical protein